MSNGYSEKTTQIVGKMKFTVISNFKAEGHSPQDKISNLLHRETGLKRLDKASTARYNELANAG